MKQVVRIILAAAAVAALAVPAVAADKLIVKDTNSNDAFKVNDSGQITESTSNNSGTNDELEYARYERSSTGTPAVGFGAKRSQLLKLGASSVVAQEQVLKWKTLTPGAEGSDFIIRNYAAGALRDAFMVSAQPFFYRYMGTGTWSTPQAAGQIILKKGLGTMSNGTGPRLAFQSDDNTGTQLVVGSVSFPVDYTNQQSSLVFTVRNSSTDSFAAFEALRVTYDGKLALGTTDPKSKIHVVGLAGPYDTVAAAQGAGLTSGAVFRTSGNVLMIVP